MNVLIVGSGRVGAFLAGVLDSEGHQVTIVDLERAAFDHLPVGFNGTTFLGNGTDLEILRQVGIDRADAFVSLTEGDNRNLMAAQVARDIFGVKRVIAKVNDPIRAQIYRSRGIDTISRTTILGMLLHAMLLGRSEVGEILMQQTRQAEDELASVEVHDHAPPTPAGARSG